MKTTIKAIIVTLFAFALTACATHPAKDAAQVELKFAPKNNDIAQFNADVEQCRKQTAKRFGDMLAGAPDSAMMSDCMTFEKGHKLAKN